MEDSKFTLKTQYIDQVVKFNVKFDVPLSRKEMKDFKNIFLKPQDPNKEKLTQYKNAIDKFILNRNQFSRMLEKSDLEYRKLPFKSNDKAYGKYLANKELIIKDYYDEYTVKKELQKMAPLAGLTDSEKKKITRDMKRSLIREQSEIQKERRKSKISTDNFNEELKRKFIINQWSVYDRFLSQNPIFRDIISLIIKLHLEEEYSIKVREVSNYSLKDDFLILIRDKKDILKKIKEKEVSLKKELFEKVKGWEKEQPFFPSVFTNSGFTLHADNFTIDIAFNIEMLYENIHRFFTNYYNGRHPRKEPVFLANDRACAYDHPFFTNYLHIFLENENIRNKISYSINEGKFILRFKFEEVIKEACKDFANKRMTLKAAPPSIMPLKEKILKKVRVAIPLSAIIIIILVFSFLFINIPFVKVEKYDSVKLDYMVWVSDEDENYDELNPDVDIIIWLTVVPVTENESTGLVLGLYNDILGKKVMFDSGLIWLNKCIDQNRDGVDDNTGQPALTYGNSTDQYFNTCLMMKFKILDIEKYSPSANLDPKKNIILYILGYVGVSIAGLLILILAFLYGHRYIQKRKLRPKLFIKRPTTKRFKLVKYGLLAALLPTIGVITMSIVNAVTPFSEILLSNKYNPFALPVVIGFIATICVLSIPIYFIIFGLLHRKFQKKRKTEDDT